MFNAKTMESRARIMDGSSRVYTASFPLHTEGGKRYAIHVNQYREGRLGRYHIECDIYCNGRALPEGHRQDIRRAAIAEYCQFYGYRANPIEPGKLQNYSHDFRHRLPVVQGPYRPSEPIRAAMLADLAMYRGA